MPRDLNNIPFAPAKCPFFYGWAILGLGTLGFLMSTPGQTMGVSPFTDHLIDALGLTRVQLSLAYMIGTVVNSLLLTSAGKLYDRVGARAMGPAASLGLGVVLLVVSQVDDIARTLGEWLPLVRATHVALIVMAVGFFLMRFFGQGLMTLVSMNMVMKWFDRYRGLASGIGGVFMALGFAATPRLLDGLIQWRDWRCAWALLGLAIGGGFSLIALLFFRDNPEDCGLQPDGRPAPETEDRAPLVRRQYTLAEARGCYAFWAFGLSFALFGLYFTALPFHIVSIFGHAGMGRDVAFWTFVPVSVISVCVRLAVGWLSSRVELKHLLAVMLCGFALSMSGLVTLSPGWPVWLLIVGNGVAGGIAGLLQSITWPNFFGRLHLGAISGFGFSLTVFASAVGPWLFSLSFAQTGSYRAAGIGCLIAVAALLASAFRADDPQRG